jgi:response regulator RpfG family c-di-GMP phosphodiesterase
MADRILCVDDEASILAAYQRALRKLVDIDIAEGGEQGLRALATGGPYAVIISDMNMPGMNGIQFLAKAREIAPDSVRMMLTGANDLGTAMSAVNEGNIFRFLTKPCPPEQLAKSIVAGIRQYRLVTAERELLEKTLSGCIGVLTEILSLVDPESFGRAESLRGDIRTLARQLKIADAWELEVAAMLAQIGNVTIPPVVTLKVRTGRPLSEVEQDMLRRIPQVGSALLGNIPRLETVARIVLYLNKRFDGGGFPADSVAGTAIPLGSRILRLLFDLAELERGGSPRPDALAALAGRAGHYDAQVLEAAQVCVSQPTVTTKAATPIIVSLAIAKLRPGQILRGDIKTSEGQLLISAGHTISAPLLERLANFARITCIEEPVLVELEPEPGQAGATGTAGAKP